MSGVLVPAHREHGIWGQKPRAPALSSGTTELPVLGQIPWIL